MLNKNMKAVSVALVLILSGLVTMAQYKSFTLSPQGDTLNIVDKKNLKQGKWVNTMPELRGEPGYDEEGYYNLEFNCLRSGNVRRG